MSNELYDTGYINSLYKATSYGGKELDLRKEMRETMNGSPGEIAKGQIGLIRRMRRDDDDLLIRCPCRNIVTDEPDMDFICNRCFGHGYLWTEQQIVYYKNDNNGYSMFYVEYTEEPTEEDFIIELERNLEGVPVSPLVREGLYKIEKVTTFRSDDGRTEYYRIKTTFDRKWSVWLGRYLDDGVQIRTPGAAS